MHHNLRPKVSSLLMWRLVRFVPPGLLRLVKRHSSSRLRLWLRERLGASHENIPDRVIQASDGRWFHIGPDRVYWSLFMGLDYEPDVTAVVRRLLRSGDVAFDLGANFGWFTTLFADSVGSSGYVHAFEPLPS